MHYPFQYSLKTSFVLILLAAAFFGGIAVQRRETERALRLAHEERERAVLLPSSIPREEPGQR
jgi:hypothetical protein